MCNSHLQEAEDSGVYPENLLTVVKILTHYSLDIWFSKEWSKCSRDYKRGLMHCLQRRKTTLESIPELALLNWNYLFTLGMQPWNVKYLERFSAERKTSAEYFTDSIESIEEEANGEGN